MKRIVTFVLLMLLIAGTNSLMSQDKLYRNTFALSKVKLLDGPFKNACELNTKVLLEYDVDRLLEPFLSEAGLQPKGKRFPNWAGLEGHVGGHYLSALAIQYAATGDMECKKRMDYMLSELRRCQQKNGDGYLGGVPNGKPMWDEVKRGNVEVVRKYWVPWYNVHKIYAGLRDAWAYGGSGEARQMFLELSDWGLSIIAGLSAEQMESMLNNEFGGMNEVYADAYQMTGDVKYLNAAKRFSHRLIFDSMAARVDNLDNRHANTQVPKAVGYQRVAELSGDGSYRTAAEFFWETVARNRSLSFGGNSRREHFPSAQDCISYTEEREGPESCNTYNMLRLAGGLFRIDTKAAYADYYERAMYNHILSTQHPEHGGYVYFTPARPAHYRVYSSPNNAMWCCVGTGMENHGKYGEFIYTHTRDSLFVNLFIASELNWEDKGVAVTQNTRFPDEEFSRLSVKVNRPSTFTLLVRYPWWVEPGRMEVVCKGRNYAANASPSSYVAINRTWRTGDVVEIKLPMKVTIEELPNVSDYISVMRGPVLLGAKTGNQAMPGLVADDSRWGHIAHGPLVSVFDTPVIIGTRDEILAKLERMQPVAGKPFSYTVPGLWQDEQYRNLVLEPFYRIHDSRYMMYWLTATPEKYKKIIEDLREAERQKLVLDSRSIDVVKPGEQQPEADHLMKNQNSTTGIHKEEAWRSARREGYFSYELKTGGRNDLALMLRYWGNESGSGTFDILIDDKLLTAENISGKWNKNEFVNAEYKIPAQWLESKEYITVKFRNGAGGNPARIFYVRLLKP